jgi:hypothetical protein
MRVSWRPNCVTIWPPGGVVFILWSHNKIRDTHTLGGELCWRKSTYQLILTYPGCLELINLFDLSWQSETVKLRGLQLPPHLFWPILLMNVLVRVRQTCDHPVRSKSWPSKSTPSPSVVSKSCSLTCVTSQISLSSSTPSPSSTPCWGYTWASSIRHRNPTGDPLWL